MVSVDQKVVIRELRKLVEAVEANLAAQQVISQKVSEGPTAAATGMLRLLSLRANYWADRMHPADIGG